MNERMDNLEARMAELQQQLTTLEKQITELESTVNCFAEQEELRWSQLELKS